ncbi:MAG: hypothetical protein D6773_02495, partial [Alphaproteobacteria bacterium]
MKLARILLPVHPRCDIAPAAKVAFTLAKRLESTVEGLHPAPRAVDQLVIQDEAGAPLQYELLLEEVKKQLKSERDTARRLFEREAAHYPEIQSDFMGCDGNVSGIVAHRGRLSDLTVLSTIDDSAPEQDFWSDVRDGAIFHSARPIVITPQEADVPDTLGETVVIAWKDSVESARAIGAARPFIVRAKAVHVVTAGTDGADEESIKDLEDYLSLYNSDIEVHVVGRNKRNVAEL